MQEKEKLKPLQFFFVLMKTTGYEKTHISSPYN